MTADPHTVAATVVPFYSCSAWLQRNWAALQRRLADVVQSGEFTGGPMAAELEAAVQRRTGAAAAVACGSGTDALVMMLRASGIRPGDEVIVPAYTFFATASSVLQVGANPVIVDVLPGSYGMDPEAAEAAVGPRTRALLPAHMFSQMANIAALAEVADRHGLLLLEDSAEAVGMYQGGRHAGRWGRAGVLSFFPAKTLGAFGDGGMVITDDERLARRVRRLRRHGTDPDLAASSEIGYNSRLDDVQAAVLLTRLEGLDEEIEARQRLAARYTVALASLVPAVQVPWQAPARVPGNQVWYVYLIECDRRDGLVEHLTRCGIETEVYYPLPLNDQPCLARLPGANQPVPVAHAASRRAVGLPLYPDLSPEHVDLVCHHIRDFLAATP